MVSGAVDVSLNVTHKHGLWIWFTLSYAMMKSLLRLAAVWDNETDRGFERWHCTIYCLEFCAGLNDAKRQHLSTINTNSDLSFTTIQQQTYRRKQSMGQADDNSLTALLAKRARVRLHEVVNTCTERRAEKRIQRTAWILSHVLHTTTQRRVNMWTVCAQPDGSMSSLLQSTGSSPYVLVHIVGPLAVTTSPPF